MDFEKELSEIYPWILKVARKFCCSMQDAEDLAGDTVYKLLVNRDKFDCSKPLQPWCLIIMRNTYIIRYNRILNIPVGTVRSRISSARKFILQEISY